MKLLFLLALPLQILAQTPVLFKNANIIDVEKGAVIANQNVLIVGNTIKKISAKALPAKGATVIDARGKYLMPGLWDMHVHVFNNVSERPPNEYYFPLLIANGVTAVREMWTKSKNMHYVKRWRKEAETHPSTVPRLVSVGMLVDGIPPNWPNSDTVRSAEEARTMVRRVKENGFDFFKVYSNLSREAYFAIADECKKLNFPFAGHVPNGISMAETSAAGQRSQEHTGYWAMFTELSDKEDKFKNRKSTELSPADRTELFQSVSEEKIQKLAAVLVKNGTSVCPTLAQYRPSMLADDERIKNDERLQYVDLGDTKNWAAFAGKFTINRTLRELRYQTGLRITGLLHKHGVGLLAGTDLGNPFIYAGFSLHDELELLVSAGLTPMAALQTATINPAKFVGKEKELGTVQEGKLADLILLNANPLEDINNTKKINAVIVNGRLLQRADLDKLLEQAKKQAAEN